MPAIASTPRPRSFYPLLLAAAAGALLAGALGLWAFYGAAVFQAMIAAGIAWCF